MKNYRKMLILVHILILLGPVLLAGAGQAEVPKKVTTEDYQRAEKFLSAVTSPLVFGSNVRPTWIDAGRFWYRNDIPQGQKFMFVDAGKRLHRPAFDHKKMAAALSEATGKSYESYTLPFSEIEFSDEGDSILFALDGKNYSYSLKNDLCAAVEAHASPDRNAVVFPR